MSRSKNLMLSATISIKLAKEARARATRRRPSSSSSGPAERRIGFSLGATSSSTAISGACEAADGCGA
jgi:hypothetical protein